MTDKLSVHGDAAVNYLLARLTSRRTMLIADARRKTEEGREIHVGSGASDWDGWDHAMLKWNADMELADAIAYIAEHLERKARRSP